MAQAMDMVGGGKLRLWEEGARVCFRCEYPLCRDGLYKVWLCGDGGEMMLGTLAPEGERLLLCRAVSREELRRCGCWPLRSARCRMAYPFRQQRNAVDGWYWEDDPARFVDQETKALGEWCRMLCSRTGNGTELAWPVYREAPIPLVHLFCLAEIRHLRGELCLVWRFEGDGTPYLSRKNNP